MLLLGVVARKLAQAIEVPLGTGTASLVRLQVADVIGDEEAALAGLCVEEAGQELPVFLEHLMRVDDPGIRLVHLAYVADGDPCVRNHGDASKDGECDSGREPTESWRHGVVGGEHLRASDDGLTAHDPRSTRLDLSCHGWGSLTVGEPPRPHE